MAQPVPVRPGVGAMFPMGPNMALIASQLRAFPTPSQLNSMAMNPYMMMPYPLVPLLLKSPHAQHAMKSFSSPLPHPMATSLPMQKCTSGIAADSRKRRRLEDGTREKRRCLSSSTSSTSPEPADDESTSTPSVCFHCRTGFRNTSGLAAHECSGMLPKQTPKPSRSSRRLICCDECSRRFLGGNDRLIWHKLVSGPVPVSLCDVCGGDLNCPPPQKKSESSTLAEPHEGSSGASKPKASRKPFDCKLCGASFIRGDRLLAHSRVHTGEKPFSCEICLRAFSRKDRLKAHKKNHLRDKTYKCSVCVKSFAGITLLTKHMAVHPA